MWMLIFRSFVHFCLFTTWYVCFYFATVVWEPYESIGDKKSTHKTVSFDVWCLYKLSKPLARMSFLKAMNLSNCLRYKHYRSS